MRRLCQALICALLCWSGTAAALQLSPEEAAGRQIFRHGTSANGSPIQARVGATGADMPASLMPCASCHGRDGRGRAEGGLRPSDITWRRLSAAQGPRRDHGRQHPPYDTARFARAVSEGLDSAGNRLSPAMPRFVMSSQDMANLAAYIKRLEDDRDPGLADQHLRLGTLLPASGPLAEQGRTLAAVLLGAIEQINEAGGIHGRRLELVIDDPGTNRSTAEAALRRLIETEQIFALLAPLAPALDGHYGELLAEAGVPLIGPVTAQGVSRSDPLIFEPLPGLREQLLALAEFAFADLALADPDVLIVHLQDDNHQALAKTLAARLQQRGWNKVRRLPFGAAVAAGEEPLTGEPQAVFYLGPPAGFGALVRSLHAAQRAPYLFASSSQTSGVALQLPVEFSERLFLAYPLLPSNWTRAGLEALTRIRAHADLDERHAPLQIAGYSAALLLGEGLKRGGRDLSREKLLTELENLHQFATGLTPPLSFGPGRRVGASGAHIVTVDLQARRFRPLERYVKVDPQLNEERR